MIRNKPVQPSGESNTSDTELLAAYLEYKPVLAAVLRRYVNPTEVDDILQDAFLRSLEAGQLNPIRHPRSFLYKTATNLALNNLKRVENKLADQVGDFSSFDVCSENDEPEIIVDAKNKFVRFCRAVATLPPQCRRVFMLKKVYGFSQTEIANALSMSESTVEKHVSKGLLLCRRYLREQVGSRKK